ncbi:MULTISPECIES: transposase family protein [Streptomyces]|uniref:DDE superfamily endonuclease n=1 Tax=Streptomyces mirabilis TaxID=68239 RepID=A0ABU3UAJ3_9ACTN|nr:MULTISPECIES: transposase family protein [unclassified Streptomyces]MDU8990927.1 hypothetical protein [Streptomyces mirabilis]
MIALTDDRGRLLWVSAARPGRTSEITACRHDKLTAHLREAGLGAIADLGFVGLDDTGDPDADPTVITGYKAARNRPLTPGQKLRTRCWPPYVPPSSTASRTSRTGACWARSAPTDPKWATTLVRALLVPTNREVAR